ILPYATSRASTRSTPTHRRAEIGGDDARVLHHPSGRAVCDLLAVVDDHDTIRDPHDRLHHVLDEDDGGAVGTDLADDSAPPVHFAGIEPAHGLVAKHEPGPRGHR